MTNPIRRIAARPETMNADMIVFRAEVERNKNKFVQKYQTVRHSGPNFQSPCQIFVPVYYFDWDWKGSCIAFRDISDPQGVIGRCRCGYVFQCVHFELGGR